MPPKWVQLAKGLGAPHLSILVANLPNQHIEEPITDIAVVGDWAVAHAKNQAISGWFGTSYATSIYGFAKSGPQGVAVAGPRGVAIVDMGGWARAGEGGCILIQRHHPNDPLNAYYVTGTCLPGRIPLPDTMYKLDDKSGDFVEVSDLKRVVWSTDEA